MSNIKESVGDSRRGSRALAIEFEISQRQALKLWELDAGPGMIATNPRLIDPPPAPIRVRAVVSDRESKVEIYYEDLNELGERHWERWTDGVSFHRIPGLTLWRRMIVAEAFRRLAGALFDEMSFEGRRGATERDLESRSIARVQHLPSGACYLTISSAALG